MDSDVSDRERQTARNYCNKFLDGIWKSVTVDQISVSAISGGMSNLLYRVALKDNIGSLQDEPREVLLRIYGSATCNIPVQVKIFNQLASVGLGPKLHSTFEEGRFEEYLPSSSLSWEQMIEDSISEVIAKKIAAIHRLNVPELDRKSGWLINNYRQMYETVQLARNRSIEFGESVLESTKVVASRMMAIEFDNEIDFLESLFKSSSIPLVFSHNDLHQNNIIFLDGDRRLEDRVVLIDFEYCSYNHLTFDLANHLSEWCFDYNGDEYPHFSFSLDRFPSEAKQRKFLTHYVNGLSFDQEYKERLFGSSLSDSDIVDLLYDDIWKFLLASNLFWSIWAVRSALTSRIQFGYWEMSKCKWDAYVFCKNFESDRFQRQGYTQSNLRASRL